MVACMEENKQKKEAMGERRQTEGDEHRIVAKPTYEEFAMYCSMAGFMKDNLKWLYGRFDDVGWLLPSGKVPKKWEDLVKKWNSLKNPSQTYRKHGFKFKTKEEKMHDCYEVWTDGSAVLRTDTKRRKYTGGAAYVILHEGKVYKQGNYGTIDTTISRMELLAIICGVGHCPQGAVVTVHSDSQYALKTLSGVYSAHKNLDLMEKFRKHSAHVAHITWRKVKSHSGVEYNELCDRLANEGRIDAEIKAGLRVNSKA